MGVLKVGISGVRGIIGDGLNPGVALEFGRAYGTFINCGKVAVARDTRTTGEMLSAAVVSGLLSAGCIVVDIGVVPTPTLFLYVKEKKLDGGIVITASHNPSQWNGIKFAEPDGTFLRESRIEKLFNIYYQKKFRQVGWDMYKPITRDGTACSLHIKKVLSSIDVKAIRKRKFKIGLDYCNGTGAVITSDFLKELGCGVYAINDKPDGHFAHEPEPVPKNLKGLCKLIRNKKLDIGFAQDPDADRLALVSDKGDAVGEEYTQVLAAKSVLSRKKGIIATNVSSSLMMDDLAKAFRTRLIRSKVGEANVAEQMKKKGALIGGEGNGGVIFPKINFVRDSIVGIGLILGYLASSGKKLSELVDEITAYEMVKGKVECPFAKVTEILDMIKAAYRKETIDLTDGIKVVWPDKWLQVRPSNTEPIIRIMTEARTKKDAHNLYLEALRQIEDLMN
ncbi:MAG: phosphoglucosamine mutase [Candidatus Omnitrophota bacterium]